MSSRIIDTQSLREIQTVVVGGVMIWGIGRLAHWFLSTANETKRIHGLFIPEWMGGTYISAGLLSLLWWGSAPRIPAPPSLTCASFGLLIGLAAGWIHGIIRLRRFQSRPADRESVVSQEFEDDGNPYRPPQNMP